MTSEVGNRSSILFWSDMWRDETLDVKFQGCSLSQGQAIVYQGIL
jgi:hypothetical protein